MAAAFENVRLARPDGLHHLVHRARARVHKALAEPDRAVKHDPRLLERQRDLVADLGLGVVDPGIGNVRQHLALEIRLHVLLERHGLGVAQLGVRLGIPLRVAADLGGLVAFAQSREHGPELWAGEAQADFLAGGLEAGEEGFAVFAELAAQGVFI